MESLQETPLLKFNPNTLEEVRKELNLTHGAIEEMLDNFESWIDKQNHFTRKNFSRKYLETSIICAKGSLERAKNTLDKLCTMKTLLPKFFSKYDVSKEIIDTRGFMIQINMPKLTKEHNRIYMIKIISTDFDSNMLLDFHRYAVLMSEYVKQNDYSLSYAVIIDCRDVNIINFVPKLNIVDLQHSMSVLMEGYSFRVNGIHLLTSSRAVDALVGLLKQVVSAKIGGRIKVHKTMDTIYEYVPKELLPRDYGGNEKSLMEVYENWRNVLSTKENVTFFKEICQSGTDEKYRLAVNFNEQILGMPGSFRSLTVD